MKSLVAVIVMGGMLVAAHGGIGVASAYDSPTTNGASNNANSMEFGANKQIIASFRPGVTTLDQAQSLLGKPAGMVRTPKGNQVIVYAVKRIENVNNDRTPETGSALPKRHRVQYSTLICFDPQGHYISSWTRSDDLGDASPSALGHFVAGDVLTSNGGLMAW